MFIIFEMIFDLREKFMNYKQLIRTFLTLIIALQIIISSCSLKKNTEGEKLYIFKSDSTGMIIRIENTSEQVSCFTLRLNHNNYNSESEIIEHIVNMPEEFLNEPLERKAWRFVENSLERTSPLTHERWQHSPLMMINSIGFGQCDDFAAVLSFIWKMQGFQARVWGLEGHVVPEVFVNDMWQMYDPIQGVYYLNTQNEVASVEVLSANPNLITNPINEDDLELNDSINFFPAIRHSKNLASKYSSINDNKINEWYDVSANVENIRIVLPSKSSLEFPVEYSSKIFTNGFLGDEHELTCYMKISIPEIEKEEMIFPFIICKVNGEGSVELNGINYNLHQDSLNQYLEKFSTLNNKIFFKNTAKNIEVYCLLNPNVFNLSGNDTIKLIGTNLNGISSTIFQEKIILNAKSGHKSEKLISELIQRHLKYYKKNQNRLDSLIFNSDMPLNNNEDIISNITAYFNSIDTMDLVKRKRVINLMVDKLDTIYPLIISKSGNSDFLEQFKDPVSFIMFVCVLEISDKKDIEKILMHKFNVEL